MILHPLEMRVPAASRRERVAAQRAAGREALSRAAGRAGAPALHFLRDGEGAPRAEGGWHHSLANTRGLVVALVAPCRVGVDAESFARPRVANLVEYLGDEPAGLASDPARAALRLWSAKEAVLKLRGLGVAGLPRCRLVAVEGDSLLLLLDGLRVRCEQVERRKHVVSVACEGPYEVAWQAEVLPGGAVERERGVR